MFNLTQQEKQVLVFIFAVATLGLGINYFLKISSKPRLSDCFGENLGKLDLNNAQAKDLMKLPGIGEKLANQIIDFRSSHAGFSDLEQLRQIKGMTAARFAKIKNFCFISD